MKRPGKPFVVDTSPTKEVVVESLTKDATVEACVFDLIDNSIDAARDTAFEAVGPDIERELLDSYDGFRVDLDFSPRGFKISDNCGGIDVERLRSGVLRFGQRSGHEMGIGIYGVGLNRALFKLGRVSHLHTDNGISSAELVLNVAEYLKGTSWDLPAAEFPTTGARGTQIEIGQLSIEVSRDFADATWLSELRDEIGRRYGRFISKGLVISVNGPPVAGHDVKIRENGPFEAITKFFKAHDGVAVFIEYGQHEDHRFTNEDGYDRDRNSELTDEFGWTVLCNDRAVLVADKTYKAGWETKFHSEFYGFVGTVSFISSAPGSLPWNTSKSDVDLNNPSYQMALDEMRACAKKWREWVEQRKKGARSGARLGSVPPAPPKSAEEARPPSPRLATPPARKPQATPQKSRPTTNADDWERRFILPADVDERWCVDKVQTLVREAKGTDLGTRVYSGLALIRMLFESAAAQFMIRHGRADEAKVFAIAARRSKGMKVPPEEERNLVPDMAEMLQFLEEKREIFGTIKAAHLRHSLKNMQAHMKKLNGVLHNPFQQVDRLSAFQIRDEVLPILRHLIEN